MHIIFVISIFLRQLLTNRLFCLIMLQLHSRFSNRYIDYMITNQETIYIFSLYMCTSLTVTLNVTLEYTSNDLCEEVNTIENRIYLIGGQLPISIMKYQFITGSSTWIDLPIESPLNPN